MLTRIGANVVNIDDIRYAYEGKPGLTGQKFVDIFWRNGLTESLVGDIAEVEAQIGTVVSAAAGLTLIEATEIDGKVHFSDPVPVVGFRIVGGSPPKPITPAGEPQGSVWATIYGEKCHDGQSGSAMPLEEWKADAKKRLQRQAAE